MPVHNHTQFHLDKHPAILHPLPDAQWGHIPDTGWRGDPPVPSRDGGDGDIDFMSKPPYNWKSEGGKFEPKHYSYVAQMRK